MKPHALVVQNSATGIPRSSPALTVNDMTPSVTIQVTGGRALSRLRLASRLQNGPKQVLLVESQRRDVLRSVSVRRRQTIGDGFETEVLGDVEGGGASGFEQAFVVVLTVDKGYVKASVM
ncbi:hypothetical protein Pyn_33652 [Prunus yedoensis var. nudiflora]|uniref:Uncharacterized protein n=1 Tax=Prunus yedoensis var. nudiflora TaxID=2094558 RepID=A0A314YZQ0_PRUYE|nr:hypothetical protein Pyn_33652 [Prunus yedoensis var. nudiflora]